MVLFLILLSLVCKQIDIGDTFVVLYLLITFVVLAIIFVIFITNTNPKFNLTSGKDRNKRLYLKLLRKAMGDKLLVERLIEAERQRLPHASENSLLKLAIERWDHHHRP